MGDRKLLTGRETEAFSVKWAEDPVRGGGDKPFPALVAPGDPGAGLLSALGVLAEGDRRDSAVRSDGLGSP